MSGTVGWITDDVVKAAMEASGYSIPWGLMRAALEAAWKARKRTHKDDPICAKCGRPKFEDCDGNGWLDPIGPCADGSYLTRRPCPNDNPYYETH